MLVHQFDKWLPPITDERNMDRYRSTIRARFSGVNVYVPEPLREFTLEDVVGK